MPWILAVLIGWGVLAAAVGRRWMICAWFGLLALAAVAGLADFYAWGYDYGHNLDAERAIIKVPGMTYQPPLIGSKKLLNFTAVSLPALGGWIAIAAGAIAGWRCWVERRLAKRASSGRAGRAAAVLAAALGLGALGCGDLPERPVDHAAMEHARVEAGRTDARARAGTPSGHVRRTERNASAGRRARTATSSSIGAAVRRAAPGARILVRPGIYREPTIVVDRPRHHRRRGLAGDRRRGTPGSCSRSPPTTSGSRARSAERGRQLPGRPGRHPDRERGELRDRPQPHPRADSSRSTWRGPPTAGSIENDITGTGTTETDSGNGIHGWYSRRVVVTSNRVTRPPRRHLLRVRRGRTRGAQRDHGQSPLRTPLHVLRRRPVRGEPLRRQRRGRRRHVYVRHRDDGQSIRAEPGELLVRPAPEGHHRQPDRRQHVPREFRRHLRARASITRPSRATSSGGTAERCDCSPTRRARASRKRLRRATRST